MSLSSLEQRGQWAVAISLFKLEMQLEINTDFFFSLLQKQSSGGGLIQLSFSKLQTFSQNEEGENLPNLCSLKIISFLQLQILSFILNFALD